MTHSREEIELAWQQAAEQQGADSTINGDPGTRSYRRLYAALRQVELPEAPEGFAIDLERAVRLRASPDKAESMEQWGVRVGLVLLLVLLAASILAYALPLWQLLTAQGHHLPWHALLASAVALLAVACHDRRPSRFVRRH